MPEVDVDEAPLAEALAAAGIDAQLVAWEDPKADWDAPIPTLLRSTWNYALDVGRFLSWVDRASAAAPLWNPPHEFVDEQLRGPYRQWIHRHTFEDRGDHTHMTDVVDYALPFYPLGEIAATFVSAQVQRIFDYRTSAIERLLLNR